MNFKHKIKPSFTTITIIGLMVLFLYSDYHYKWKEEKWKSTVFSDAAQYYRYLPTILIDHKIDTKEENPTAIKYYIGTSLFYLPFFYCAYAISAISHLPIDGYSLYFMIFVSIGTLFYLLLGFFYFAKFLKFYKIKPWVSSLMLLAMSMSTIAYYTVLSPGWSHIVGFFLVCLLLYHVKKLYHNYNKTSIFVIIVSLSFLFFVRPSVVLIVTLFPFLADNFQSFRNTSARVLKEWKTILISVLVALIPAICQLLLYKVSTGEYLVWSYKSEGFDFLNPHIFNELFSYSKGLLFYSPICLFSLFGLIKLYQLNKYQFFGTVLYLIINVYVISSWWCWNYGATFGTRAFIEMFPVFFFLITLLLSFKNNAIKALSVSLILLFSSYSIFQIYQNENKILDNDFRTDAKGYWSTFLKTEGYSGKDYRYPVDERKENIIKHLVLFNDVEKVDSSWINNNTRTTEKAHSGVFSSKVKKDTPYSIGVFKKIQDIPYTRNVLIRVSGWFYIAKKGSHAFMALCFSNNGSSFCFNSCDLDLYMNNYGVWEYKTFELYMPKFTVKEENKTGNQFETYLFNDSDVDCYVDDLKLEFIQFKNMERVLDNSWDI
jgi:hypothetical protein